ncbi:MAG: hypothetical protein DRI34_03530 [Deltaproteobacteria bacterium]|nr:MAG: hypothetical protein DRI34_03530 [Deltaproteobacteria bacterium]
MSPNRTGRTIGWLLLLPLALGACDSDFLQLDPYPHCSSYPCQEEIAWWQQLWREERHSSRRPADGPSRVAARQQVWQRLHRLGRQAEDFNGLCRRQGCSSLQVALHRQQVVYHVQSFLEHGIPPPPARGRPRPTPAFVDRWREPLLLLVLLGAGLLAACLRWGVLGAYAFAGLGHELRRRGARLLDGLRWSLPPGTRWPALWTGLFLLAGWLTFISMNGGEAAWRLLLGGKP